MQRILALLIAVGLGAAGYMYRNEIKALWASHQTTADNNSADNNVPTPPNPNPTVPNPPIPGAGTDAKSTSTPIGTQTPPTGTSTKEPTTGTNDNPAKNQTGASELLNVELSVELIHEGRGQYKLSGVTNLPPGTIVTLGTTSLTGVGAGTGVAAGSAVPVLPGSPKNEFSFSCGEMPANLYRVHVGISAGSQLRPEVRQILGEQGEFMSGRHVTPTPSGGKEIRLTADLNPKRANPKTTILLKTLPPVKAAKKR